MAVCVRCKSLACALKGLAIILLVSLLPRAVQAADTLIYLDIPYIPDGDTRQVLDIYLPAEANTPLPTLLLIHGGGFLTGSKSDLHTLARHWVERGYAVVVLEYRLAPEHIYPAPVQDAFCALAWLQVYATDYGFDIQKLAVLGESVGGTLAALLGTVDDARLYMHGCPYTLSEKPWTQAVIAFYPVVNLDLAGYSGFFEPYLGVPCAESPDLWAEASPLHWVDGDDPPFLLIHGLWDVRVPVTESESLAHALESAGVSVELMKLPRTDHRFILTDPDSPAAQESLSAAEAFLESVFKPSCPPSGGRPPQPLEMKPSAAPDW